MKNNLKEDLTAMSSKNEEIDGLRAQLEERYILMRVRQLEHALDAERQTVRRLRAVLEGIRITGPDADGLVWATIQHPSISVRSNVTVGSVDRTVSQALEFEQIRRNALEDKL